MNKDRCYHIPMSEGQTLCSCEDHRMFLELLIEMQARHIAHLERRFQQGEVRMILNGE